MLQNCRTEKMKNKLENGLADRIDCCLAFVLRTVLLRWLKIVWTGICSWGFCCIWESAVVPASAVPLACNWHGKVRRWKKLVLSKPEANLFIKDFVFTANIVHNCQIDPLLSQASAMFRDFSLHTTWIQLGYSRLGWVIISESAAGERANWKEWRSTPTHSEKPHAPQLHQFNQDSKYFEHLKLMN